MAGARKRFSGVFSDPKYSQRNRWQQNSSNLVPLVGILEADGFG